MAVATEVPMFDWAPTINDVAALIRARTKNAFGSEAEGTFGTGTRPTAAQVQLIIDNAVKQVAARCGASETNDFCSAELKAAAGGTAALRAAAMVELSYFPEQTGTDQSAYDRLIEQYDKDIRALAESAASQCGLGAGNALEGAPRAFFPTTSGVMGGQYW